MPVVVVIGAGVVGASVAYALSLRGAHVTVLEAERPAAGTTRASFAWANANDKPPRDYHALNAAGLAEHHRLAEVLAGQWFHPTGNLEIATDASHRARLAQKLTRLEDWGYHAELVSAERARELAPDAQLPEGPADYAFYPQEGWVAAPVLAHCLLEAAVAHGARVVFPARATALEATDGRVVGVQSPVGSLRANWVIDCSGPTAGTVLEPLGWRIARRVSRGVLAVAEPMPTCLARIVHASGVHLRPDGAGRVLFGSVEVDEMLAAEGDPSADSEVGRELLRRAQAVLPALAGARIEALRLGWRPMPADGFSAVGTISGVSGYYLVFTHSGVTLGPILGKLVAEEIVEEAPQPMLASFRPERLLERLPGFRHVPRG